MVDIAQLGYNIDSSQARTAAKDLDRMAAAADKAERGARDLASASRNLLRNEKGQFMGTAESAAKYAGEIDALRAKYNPLYAASKQFEASQAEIKRALELGAISVGQAEAALERLNAQMVVSQAANDRFGASMDASAAHTTNLLFQFQDIAMMMASGQNPLILAMQQGAQVSGIFYQMRGAGQSAMSAIGSALMGLVSPMSLVTIGVIAGGAALVQWGMSALGAGENTKTFEDALTDLQTSVSEMNAQMNIWTMEGAEAVRAKYGEINAELAQFIAMQNQITQIEALNNARDSAAALLDELQGWESSTENLSEIFPSLLGRVNHLINGLQTVKTARTFEEQLAALTNMRSVMETIPGGIQAMTSEQFKFYSQIVESEDAIRQMIAAQPKGDFLSSAISKARELASAFWDAARAKASATDAAGPGMTTGNADWAKNQLGFLLPGSELLPPSAAASGGGGRSGGGGGGGGQQDQYANNLQSLIESLQTEQQTVDEWYQENLTILEDRRASEILGEQAHKDALLALEQEYLERKKGLNEGYNQFSLDSASALFGEMYSLTGSSLSGLLKLQKTFGAASALVNTYTAAAQVLADPSLGFFAKFAAVAKTVAAGMGLVNAINGGGGGGAGRAGGTTSATSATASEPNRVTRVELVGDDWLVNLAESMMTQIYDASRDGRVIVARG